MKWELEWLREDWCSCQTVKQLSVSQSRRSRAAQPTKVTLDLEMGIFVCLDESLDRPGNTALLHRLSLCLRRISTESQKKSTPPQGRMDFFYLGPDWLLAQWAPTESRPLAARVRITTSARAMKAIALSFLANSPGVMTI